MNIENPQRDGNPLRVFSFVSVHREVDMGRSSRLTERAIKLTRSGKLADARILLDHILREEPDNWLAWAWYFEAARDDDDRILALENLIRIRPGQPRLQEQLASLLRQQNQKLKASRPGAVQGWKAPSILFSCLLAGMAMLIMAFLVVRNVQASRRIDTLNAINTQVTANYNLLDLAHNDLKADFQSLSARNEQLTSAYQYLEGELLALRTNYDDLVLQYDLLNRDFSSLESKAIVPPYIYIRDRDVWTAFERTDGQLIYWKTPFEGLEYDLQRGSSIRLAIDRERDLINSGRSDQVSSNHWLRLPYPDGSQIAYVVDERRFVDWQEFKAVIPELYSGAQNEQAFIREIWNIVAQLTTYSVEITDTPRYPLETLLAGGGDCEDTAILFSSMILAAPVDWDVSFVYMDGNNPFDFEELNHVIVHIETDSSSYHIETTSKTTMDPYQGYVDGWYFKIDK